MLTEILALVHDRSSEKRAVLFRMISDLFTEDATLHSNRELLLFGDVLARLLDQVDLEDRVAFSEKVAPIASTPRVVALKLADDDHRVAAPVLQHSPVLTEADLIDFATRKGDSHRIAIAQRTELGESLTEVLVDHGGHEVLTTVSSNAGARFSHRSMGILADRATTSEKLAEALAGRADVPPAMAEGLLRLIGPAARARLEQMAKSNEAGLSRLVVQASRELNEGRQGASRNRMEAGAMAEGIRLGHRSADAVVEALVDQKRVLDLAAVLAEVCHVPEAHVNSVLLKIDSHPIAVLARVAGVTEAAYARLTRMRCDKLNLAESQANYMLSVFRNLDLVEAEKALEFHRKRHPGQGRRAG